MGKRMKAIPERLKTFIENQKIFFVGTAAPSGRVNVSPKGTDSFRVIDENKIVWLNLTGSGNETAAHLLQNDRMTIMFCAFDGNPLILRLYGNAKIYHQRDTEYDTYINMFPEAPSARQIVEMKVDLVQTSCGFGVPFMEYKDERHLFEPWAAAKGEDGLQEYWEKKNTESIDGFETGILGN
ncbi:pyridoxamine 5'-phosphate oxidase family protein [Aureisphaera galaxeae]|uniref:pyridoxamine 5'-phosphate oxidase family protein n=1 Tax=Aureisphaera galaxeae TaxID=1538023 RepID=UPI00235014E1|nr:pyridoxamine 5'-phosphate oxidase family protein [Aureisphaera galaxeae]MDC8006080.1 pyridoxamine 5'-phosphate oxidase family protein [Aureisphaera galaxeae]